MIKKRINVTARDIAYGERKSEYSCPIARAMRRVVGPVQVYDTYAVAFEGSVDLPVIAQEFVMEFDAGNSVEPFKFEVYVNG